MWKNNITFVIFAYNEEKRIEYPIRNFIDYGEVIVIDNFSEDKTKEIAEKYWAKVYQYKNQWYVETQEELDFVRSKLKTDYVVRTFADIIWDKLLLEDTIKIISDVIDLDIQNTITGKSKIVHDRLKKLNTKR